jgi:hypothetical protein
MQNEGILKPNQQPGAASWGILERRCLVAQRNSHGRVRVYLTLHTDPDWIASCGISFDSPSG